MDGHPPFVNGHCACGGRGSVESRLATRRHRMADLAKLQYCLVPPMELVC